MKAAIVSKAGENPAYGDFADPIAGEGELLVTVAAAALSQLTRSRASGTHYSASGQLPLVPGVDGVGRLDDGRRVYFLLPRAPYGAMAERTVVPADRILPLPDSLDDVTAAALANPGMSSWVALKERARFRRGETVLVNGATGASGQLAIQIARHLGAARVIATGRNPEVLATLPALGADVVIPLTNDAEAMEASFLPQFAEGVDVALDYLWGPSAEALLIAGARAGAEAVPIRFVQIGTVGGATITLPGAALRSSAIELMGSGLGSVTLERLIAGIAGVLDAAGPAGLRIGTTALPLSEVAQGWTRRDGRVVFTPG